MRRAKNNNKYESTPWRRATSGGIVRVALATIANNKITDDGTKDIEKVIIASKRLRMAKSRQA